MSDPELGADKGEETLEVSPASDKPSTDNSSADPTASQASGTGDGDKGGDENRIPQSRVNEMIAKEREKAASEVAAVKADMEERFSSIKEAFTGSKKDDEKSSAIKAVAEKHGLSEEVIADIANLSASAQEAAIAEAIKPFKAQQAQSNLNLEFDSLYEKYPESKDMSKEDKASLRNLSLQKENLSVPLHMLYAATVYKSPQGVSEGPEAGSAGSRGFKSDVSISDMSDEEFQAHREEMKNSGK